MILTDKSDDDSHDIAGSIDDDGCIFRILGHEAYMRSLFLEAFQSDFAIEGGDDDIPTLCCACSVEDHDISCMDPSTFHTVSFDPYEVGRCWVVDEIGFEVHPLSSSRLWSEGKSCRDRLKEGIGARSCGWHILTNIYGIKYTKYTYIYSRCKSILQRKT